MSRHRSNMRDGLLPEAPFYMREIPRMLKKGMERLIAELEYRGG